MPAWNPVWSQSITALPLSGKVYGKNKTAIFRINANAAGDKIRFRFSNVFGKTPYSIGAMTVIINGKSHAVTLAGKTSFFIPQGGKTYSDAVPLAVGVGDEIEIRIYCKSFIADGNTIEERASLLSGDLTKSGDKVANVLKQPIFVKILGTCNAVPALDMIEVESESPTKSIVAFGDSITAMSQWTKPLEKRLCQKFGGQVVLLNAGISGNCLLYERPDFFGPLYGKKGVERFANDVLSVGNLHSVIIGLGINDVSYYTKKTKDVINLETFKAAITDIVQKAHNKGVKVIMQTLTPRLKCAIIMGIYKKGMEKQRLLFNDWIRNADIFDYVFDADALVSIKTKDGYVYDPRYHKGDHLHPNREGGLLLANAFDLTKLV